MASYPSYLLRMPGGLCAMFINNFFERYARLMIEEYEEDLTFTLSAGVQRVIWSGCMIPKVTIMSFIHTEHPGANSGLHKSSVPDRHNKYRKQYHHLPSRRL